MTSVKEIRVEEPATADGPGRGAFVFTDDYSVFDWGKMPDAIPGKGAALCTTGAHTFEVLEGEDVPTHYRGVVADGKTRPLSAALDTGATPREMAVDLVTVPDLPAEDGSYDYDAFHDAAGSNYLVPLEVVFRNRVPVGSSLRRRSEPVDHGLDYEVWPDEPVGLPEPVVEFSTKYERQDRYLARGEADRIAGAADLDALEGLAREVDRVVTECAREAGLVHEDGKIECLYSGGEVRVADVAGTFDENRFSHEGRQVSKEVLRQYHERTQPGWVGAVREAKRRARAEGIAGWTEFCDHDPDPLDGRVVGAVRDLYRAGANAYVDREVFDAPPLAAAVDATDPL
jgi:phosphoribosylaminoimidazole-succinocarboxamide synthase